MFKNKWIKFCLLLVITAFLLVSCARSAPGEDSFALYLVPGVDDPRAIDPLRLDELVLSDEPVFSEPDILSYDLSTHTIELTDAGYTAVADLFTLPIDVNGIPFVVVLSGERLYHGAFYSPASSLSYEGVVIGQPFGDPPNTVVIGLSYPGPGDSPVYDPRNDPRILQWLENR